ncbi:Ribonuclease H-like protein [Apiospora kogelbergensis]|uniref:Ribonuclease H-like protein n=1 Tax=Apiospora kogelbergensis TaxID=1337665 RepID=A0AAW0QZT4_9PEZI
MYGTKRDNFAELLRTVGSIHPDTDITEGGRDMVAADVQALNEALDEVIFYEEPPELEFGEDTTYEGLDLLDDPIATSQAQVMSFPTPDVIDSASLDQYRKQGPGGKLHNIGIYLHRSSQLKMALEKAQLDIDPDHEPLSWIQNVPTRWESDEAMFERALKLKYPLQRMLFDIERDWSDSGGLDVDKPAILKEALSNIEWKQVESLQKLLHPFKVASKQLQGQGIAMSAKKSSGALHEYFPQIELLLDHLESAVDGEILSPDGRSFINIFDGLDQETRQVFRVYIRLGWKKLDVYYNSMTSLAYYMAVILHPCKKMKQLDDLWAPLPCRQTDQWKDSLNKRLRKFWQADYANRCVHTIAI